MRSRFAVLRALLQHDAVTRQDLARITRLSAATVATIVTELLAAGVIAVASVENTGVGRPHARLQIDPDRGRILGIDVAETYVFATAYDLRLEPLGTFRVALDEHKNEPEYVVAGIAAGVEGVLQEADIPRERVVGAGVSLPGQVQPDAGVSVFAPNWNWHDVQIESMLATELGVPVHVDNPLKAIVAAELWFSPAYGQNLVMVNLGTGVGVGIALNGDILRGASNNAGEWGHTMLVLDGRECRCGRRGCVEAYVGAPGMQQTLAELAPDHPAVGLSRQSAFIDAVAHGLAADDPQMIELLERTCRYLAAGLGDIINVINPEQIILTGWTTDKLGGWLLPLVTERLDGQALESSLAEVSVGRSLMPGNLVTRGMATLSLEGFLAGVGLPSRSASR